MKVEHIFGWLKCKEILVESGTTFKIEIINKWRREFFRFFAPVARNNFLRQQFSGTTRTT
jgi:hypothetical protein